MVLKTFNVQEEVYKKFSSFCKSLGISMSKQVEIFMESMVEEEPKAKQEYLEKLERIRKQKTIHIGSLDNFRARYEIE
jgi:antitoxin component of RelBE/YafQ-DinJ toxin-antitoxin module|tara:strand:- start:49 stop:282 length:234 start_codon:yes stop_codon:yes gene_type:complete